MTIISRLNYLSGTVGATPVVLDCFGIPPPVSFTVIPGSANTSLVEISNTSTAVENPGGATWLEWPSSVVNVATRDVSLGRVVAVRFTRITGTSLDKYEVA
jgi:hypothetical protein